MSTTDISTRWFPPTVESTREAREWLAEVLHDWRLDAHLAEDALLCGVELATNAVLHVRRPYGAFARRADSGVHIAMIDEQPEQLPEIVPITGSASDILRTSRSGRGLQIVAALASRWGINTSQHAKSVWFEVEGEISEEPTQPVIVLGHTPDEPAVSVELCFVGLPVRAAVASGVQVEELLRQVQLTPDALDDAQRERFLDLLDTSAPARLGGRHAALRASAAGHLSFDLVLSVPVEALAATGELSQLLGDVAQATDEVGPVDDNVAAFRSWLNEEATRQLDGEKPRPFPT